MSKIVEERVVQMEFDNSNFEKNVKSSMSSLDKLKDQFKNLTKIDFSPLKTALGKSSDSIDEVTESTNILSKSWTAFKDTIAIAGLQEMYRLATKIRTMVESLTFGNITAGYNKMTETVTSTATLVSQGYDLKEVNKQLERLLWFTDETSYNFTDMVSNISKFTAAGQSLENSMTAMEGIATWAALSGQNARTASNAMYQLSQAMGSFVKREDWKSIQTANMDTQEFRKTALDTAVAMGTLKKKSDGTYSYMQKNVTKAKEVTFDIKGFVDSLTEGAWLTADVLVATLKKYGGASDQLREAQDAFEEYSGKYLTASEVIEMAQANMDKANPDRFKELAKEMGLSTKETKKLQELTASIDEFGIKAFLAAQEAKSFSDAISATKDAVSTKWMNIFQNIFGDYNQQRKLWTNLANDLYTIFAEPYEYVLEILDRWHERGGYDSLFAGFSNIMKSFMSVLEAFRRGLRNALGLDTEKGLDRAGNLLIKISKGFESLTKKLMPSKKVLDIITKSTELLVKVFTSFFKVIKSIVNGPGSIIVRIFKSIGEAVTDLFNRINMSSKMTSIMDKIDSIIKKITNNIGNLSDKIKDFLDKTQIVNTVVRTLTIALQNIKNVANIIIDTLKSITTTTKAGGLNESLTVIDLATMITTFNSIKNFIKTIKDTFVEGKALFDNIDGIIKNINKALSKLGDVLNKFTHTLDIANLTLSVLTIIGLATALLILSKIDVEKIIPAILALGAVIKMLPGLFSSLDEGLKSLKKISFGDTIKRMMYMKSIVESFVILAVAIKILSTIGWKKMWPALTALGLVLGAVVGIIEILGHSKINSKSLKGIKIISTIAWAMIPMSIALKILSTIGWKKMWPALIALGSVLGTFVGVIEILGHTKLNNKAKKSAGAMLIMALAMIPIASALKKLSTIKWESMKKSLVAFGAVVGLMVGSLFVISKMTRSAASIKSALALFIAMGGSIYVMGLAFNLMKGFNWKQIGVALAGFGGVIIALGVAMKIMSKTSKTVKGGFSLSLKDGLTKGSSTKTSSTPVGSLLGAAIAVYVIAKAFSEIASFNWKQMITTVGSLVVFLYSYVGMVALLSAIQKGSGDNNGVLKITAGLLLFAIAVKKLINVFSDMEYINLTDIGKGFLVIVASLVPLVAMTNLLYSVAPAMLMISGAILAFSIACNLLNASTIESAANATLMQATAVAVAQAEWTKFEVKWNKFKAFLPNILEVIKQALLAILKFLPDLIKQFCDSLMESLPTIFDTLKKMIPYITDVAIKLLIDLIDQLTEKVPTLLSSLGKLLGAIFECIRSSVTETMIDDLINVGLGLAAFLGSMALLKYLGKSAMVGILYFGACMAELTVVLSALGLIDKIPGIEKLIGQGGNLLGSIGTAIGKFIGGILGGIANEFSNNLPDIGKNLSKFMKNLSGFISGATNIPSGIGKKIAGLSAGIAALDVASFTNTWSKILTFGAGNLADLGTEVSDFLSNLSSGLKKVKDIPADAVTSISNLMVGISKLASIDYKNLEDVIDNLSDIGTKISDFVTNVSGLTEENVASAELAVRVLSGIISAAKDIPNSGGLAGVFAGENDLYDFVSQLSLIASPINTFAKALRNIELSDVDVQNTAIACHILKELALAADSIPNTGGLAGLFAGDNDLGDFSANIATLGEDLSSFVKAIKDISDAGTVMDTVTTLLTKMAEASKVDISSLPTLFNNIKDTIPSFVKKLKKVKKEDITSALERISTIFDYLKSLKTDTLSNLASVLDAVKDVGTDFVNKFTSSLNSKDSKKRIATYVNRMFSYAVSELNSKDNMKLVNDAGANFVTGFAQGINNNKTGANTAAALLGSNALAALKNAVKEKSPSKATFQMGEFFDQGFINGITNKSKDVVKVSNRLGEDTLNALNKSINSNSDIFNMEGLSDPVIKPILDLTDLQNGVRTIDGMFDNPIMNGNISAISRSMRDASQNGTTNDVISAINKLGTNLSGGNTYNINGITYDGDSAVANAIETLVHAVTVERRV